MNSSLRILSLGVLATSLIACGGSGGSGGVNHEGQGNGEPEPEPELVIEFAGEPLEPKVFNLASIDLSTQRDFDPGETISSTWFASVRYSDNSSLGQGEQELYQATAYLSVDNEIQTDLDLELFSLECSVPITSEHACGPQASFQTIYSPGNENIFETISIPLNRSKGLTDYQVDSTLFMDQIPKTANVIMQICLVSEPEKCDQTIIDLELF